MGRVRGEKGVVGVLRIDTTNTDHDSRLRLLQAEAEPVQLVLHRVVDVLDPRGRLLPASVRHQLKLVSDCM